MPNTTDETFVLKTKAETDGLRKMESDLGELVGQMEDLGNDTADSGEKAEDAEGKFTNFANNALAAFTGLIGAQVFTKITGEITAFVGEVGEWNNAFNRLNATTDLTDAQFGELKNSALDVFQSGFGENMTEITDNLSNAQRQTGLWGNELEGLTEGAMTLDDLFGVGFNETIRAVDGAMTNFGANSQTVMDGIAGTLQKVGDPAGDLLDTVNEYSSTFANAGYSSDEMFDALIQGNEAGIYAFDKSADAIREFGIRTREGSEAVQTAYTDLFAAQGEWQVRQEDGTMLAIDSWSELQTAISDGSVDMALVGDRVSEALQGIEDPIERNRIAAEILGTQYEDLGEGILQALDIKDEGNDFAGTMEEMQKASQEGLQPALERLERTIKVRLFKAIEPLVTKLVQGAIPAIEGFADLMGKEAPKAVEFVSDKLEDLGNAVLPPLTAGVEFLTDIVEDNKDTIQTFGEYFGKAAGLVGGVVGIIAGASAALSGMGVVAGVAAGAFTLLTSPIALAIGLLVAFQYAYKENFLGFGDTVKDGVEIAKTAIEDLTGFIGGLIAAFQDSGLEGVGNFIKEKLIDPLVTGLQEYVTGGQLQTDAATLGKSILTGIETGLDLAANAGTWINENLITPLATAAAEYVSSGGLKDTMYSLGKGMMDGIKIGIALLGGLGLFIATNIIIPLATAAAEYVASGQLWDNLQTLGSGVWDAIKAGIALIGDIGAFVLENIITPFAAGALASLTDPAFIDALQQIGTSALTYLAEGLVFAADWVTTNLITPLAGLIAGVSLDSVKSAMSDIGTTMMTALSDAVSAGAGAIEGAVKGAINAAIPDHVGFSIGAVEVAGRTIVPATNVGIDIPNPFPGYQKGTAWTGFGALNEVAGWAHRREAVVPAGGMAVYPSPKGLQLAGQMPGMDGGQPIVLNITLELDGEIIYNRMQEIKRRRAP